MRVFLFCHLGLGRRSRELLAAWTLKEAPSGRARALEDVSWYAEAIKATWRGPQDIRDQYASASICGNNRVVFNVGGNKYRLVVEVQYQAGIDAVVLRVRPDELHPH